MASLTKAEKIAQAQMTRRAIVDSPGLTLEMPPVILKRTDPEVYSYLLSLREVLMQWQTHNAQQLMTLRQSRISTES